MGGAGGRCAATTWAPRDRRAIDRANVEGSRRTFRAAPAAGARTVTHASSIGAYAPGPKNRLVDEQ